MEMKVKRREWVKTAAIVFLAVLLVLTFFSNTVMNYSLPQVATVAVDAGSINARIRGNGTVAANETYEVKLEQTRKIASILVREGQSVAVGDTLILLETDESEELKAAQEKLEQMELDYRKSALAQSNTTAEQKRELTLAQQAYDNALALYRQYSDLDPQSLAIEKVQAEQELKSLEQEHKQLQSEVADLQDELADLEDDLADVEAEIADAEDAGDTALVSELQDECEDLEREISSCERSLAGAEREARDAQNEVLDHSAYIAELAEASSAAQDVTAKKDALDELLFRQGLGNSDALDIQATQRAIEEQRKLVEQLLKTADGAEVTAPVAGVIGSVEVTAGSTAGAQMTLVSIDVVDRGYMVKIPVTSDQARKVRLGDQAELVNYWGADATAILESITSDPSNPGKGKLLCFRVDGDVQPNQNLTLSIGQKSANYDCVVPNAAVRTDNNGTFVLVVTAKSSPLGNRYTATRVDVEVLATDDTRSAVTGLGYGDFVITTSNKPIEAGTQVRLADNA